MSVESLRLLERAHGVLAWLAVAALALAAWNSLRRGPAPRRALPTALLAASLVALAFGTGLALDAPYRSRLRQRLFLDSMALGWLFERKEHLAFGALALTLCALGVTVGRALSGGRSTLAAGLRRAGLRAWSASALLALAASVASAVVAHRRGF